MSLSFWFSLFVCIGAFLEALVDHRETLEAFRAANTDKEKRWNGFKLWVYWVVFSVALLGVFVSGWESVSSNKTSRDQAAQIKTATNKVGTLGAQLNEAMRQLNVQSNALAAAKLRPVKQRIIDCLNSIDSRIIQSLKTGQTKFGGELEESQLNELANLAREPEASKIISVRKGGVKKGYPDGRWTENANWDISMDLLK